MRVTQDEALIRGKLLVLAADGGVACGVCYTGPASSLSL